MNDGQSPTTDQELKFLRYTVFEGQQYARVQRGDGEPELMTKAQCELATRESSQFVGVVLNWPRT